MIELQKKNPHDTKNGRKKSWEQIDLVLKNQKTKKIKKQWDHCYFENEKKKGERQKLRK